MSEPSLRSTATRRRRRPPLQTRRNWFRVELARRILPSGYGVCITGMKNPTRGEATHALWDDDV